MSGDGVELTSLDSAWEDSIDDPMRLFQSDNPATEVGSFVIRPGERVPEKGWTSHQGDELSLIIEGTVKMVTRDDEYTLSKGTLSMIPSGVEHYSLNRSEDPVKLVYIAIGGL
jgi:mannose-6-phosphate isomerase-like protein (cupin superfamily)